MASGKSHVGSELAKRLGYELINIDGLIEKQESRSIREIFNSDGEYNFRKLEEETISTLRDKTNSIIVTGGGAVTSFNNAHNLKNMGQIFFLDAALPLIIKRLSSHKKRPLGLVVTAHDLKRLEELYIYRRPLYANLGDSIDVNHENMEQTCVEIIERYQAKRRIAPLRKTIIHETVGGYPIFHETNSLKYLKDIVTALGYSEFSPLLSQAIAYAKFYHRSLKKLTKT